MGWIKNALGKVPLFKKIKYADSLNGTTPIFTQFGQNIYASDVVQQAVACIVSEVSKLQPMHVRKSGDDWSPVAGKIQKVLENPNTLMSKSDFLEKITWQLMLNYNAFVVPVFKVRKTTTGETRELLEMYPVQPTQVDFIEDASQTMFVKFTFANNFQSIHRYEDVIHIRKNYSVNDYMGGNAQGMADVGSLLQTLQLNKDLLKGVSAAMKSSFAINGVVKIGSIISREETKAALKEFEKQLKNSESGILPLDAKSEYIKISRDTKLVDAETLKFVDEKILRFFGVSLAILTGDYTKEQYEAFYQKTIEPLGNKLSEAFTKGLFTTRERDVGNQVAFYPRDLIFMSVSQTLEMVRLLGDSGSLYENEKRVAFGLKPLEELKGVRMQSLNYVDVRNAAKYQIGKNQEKEVKHG